LNLEIAEAPALSDYRSSSELYTAYISALKGGVLRR